MVAVAVAVRGNLIREKGSVETLRCAAVSKKGIGDAWKMATVALSPFPGMATLVTVWTSVEARTTLLHFLISVEMTRKSAARRFKAGSSG